MSMDNTSLQRFLTAQADCGYEDVLAELRHGRKVGHWIWFIFPQLRGLGQSTTSEFYGIRGLAEAVAYLQHPILGPRLRECVASVLSVEGVTAEQIFGFPDVLKFHSSLTLFSRAARELGEEEEHLVFRDALHRYYGGQEDGRTLALLGRASDHL